MKPPPQNPLRVISDAARRMSDLVTQALTDHGFNAVGGYMAFRLSDGGGDGRVYADRAEAMRFQSPLSAMCYMLVRAGGITPREAEAFLSGHRQMHDGGLRMPHPEDARRTPEIELPGRVEDWKRSGLILPPHLRTTR